MGNDSIIRSFVCNTKRPSVKQSIKWQVSSNFQIYPGKTDEPPQYQTRQLYRSDFQIFRSTCWHCWLTPLVSLWSKSWKWYTALHSIQLYIYLLSLYQLCHLELSKWTGQSCICFYAKFLSISLWFYHVVVVVVVVVVVYYTTTYICCCCCCCCVLHHQEQ